MNNILITGGTGRVGRALQTQLTAAGISFTAPDRRTLNLCDRAAVNRAVAALRPKLIINAAAYTDVDAAEYHAAEAEAVNHYGAAALAGAAEQYGAVMLHLSTDYVFDGRLQCPYRETDPPRPVNIYGRSKLAGERAVQTLCRRSVIVRTAWLFGGGGGDFVQTVLRLAQRQAVLPMVAHQYGSPTRVGSVAAALLQIGRQMLAQPECGGGLYHFAGYPHISRLEWTRQIVVAARRQGLLTRLPEIVPVAAVPARAARPPDSRLDCGAVYRRFGIRADDWQAALLPENHTFPSPAAVF